jgi:type VI secretion system protein ImpM
MSDGVFGAFGKMPSVGDFFRISAPNAFVQVWDDWLQKCLLSGAHTFGTRWDDLYMSVPIWRFCLSENLAGPDKMMGVLMPSVDRVGRRFPLTLMAPLPQDCSVLLDHFLQDDLFSTLEDTALSMLEDEATRDGLVTALTGVPGPAVSGMIDRPQNGSAVVVQHALGQGATPAIVAATCLAGKYANPSVWSAVMQDDTRLMVCDGLPQGANMQGLFDLDADVWKEDAL